MARERTFMPRWAALGLAVGWLLGCGGTASEPDPGSSTGGGGSASVPGECAGTSGAGAYRGSFCSSGTFANAQLSCAEAHADCVRKAQANPDRSVFCTWNNRVIHRVDVNAGACNSLVCDSVLGQGQYRGYFCGSYAFANTPDSTCPDALTNCESNARSNPDMSLYCTWQGQEIYRREKTAGDCSR